MVKFTRDRHFERTAAAVGVLLLCLLATKSLRAETPAEPEPGATEASSGLADVLRTGARWFGKSASRGEGGSPEQADGEPKGTSSGSIRKSALSAIPLDKLSPENQKRVGSILKSVSFYRRLPKATFAIEPEVYGYFVAHPDVAVSIWRAMKISKLQMWQTGRFDYEADTGDGSVGKLEVLHSGPEHQLVICDGEYKSPLFTRSIAARSLLLLQTSFLKEADGTVYCTHRADLWVSFPSQTVDVVSKIFSPLAVAMTDRTFSEISVFLKMMSMQMTKRPDWVEQIATRMEGVPEMRKEQLLTLTAQVYSASQKRALEQETGAPEISPAALNPPRTSEKGAAPGTPVVPTTERKTAAAPAGDPGGPPGTARVISADQAPPVRQ